MMDDSLADLSHLRKFSWEMGLDNGGFEAIPACRAILRYVLLIREELVFQDLTVLLGSFLASECSPILGLGRSDKLIPLKSSSFCSTRRITLDQSEIKLTEFVTQPLVRGEVNRDLARSLQFRPSKRVVIRRLCP